MGGRDRLIKTIRWQRAGFAALGAPFYAALADELVRDVERGGRVWQVLGPFADAAVEDGYVLRLLGGVHRMALSGEASAIRRHFPSTGGDGDARAAMAELTGLLAEPPPPVLDALRRPPQTNEVGRAAALASGLLVIAERFGLPLRVREIGASGGLNLRLDSYWYEQDGRGWGTPTSAVRFSDLWVGGAPPFAPGAEIVDRRGCDRDPIDTTSDDGALTLLSYIWPEPEERFVRARDAMALARGTEAVVDRAEAVEWLPSQLSAEPGTVVVIYHSVMWQYVGAEDRSALRSTIFGAGARATAQTPVAWLRLEPTPQTYVPAELRLNVWDGGAEEPERLLATTGFHGGVINWNPRSGGGRAGGG